MAKLTLSLGSNLGDREHYLARARRLLADRIGPLTYTSPVVETPAWGRTEQPAFLNQVVTCNATILGSPASYLHALLDTTQAIEAALHRTRALHWGPRTIDIDLLFLDDLRYEDARISLPHPWWRQRPFVTDLLPPDTYAHAGVFYAR